MKERDNYTVREVVRVKEGVARKVNDKIVREEPVTIFLNDEELVTLMCTPEELKYLALGFLCSEGFLEEKADLEDLRVDGEKGLIHVETRNKTPDLAKDLYGRRTITTGCGKGTTFFTAWDSLRSKPVPDDGFRVEAAYLLTLIKSLQERAELFQETGGVHSTALCSLEGIIYFSEDVGRHNALDKIAGRCFWDERSLKDKILVSSGRISSEIMLKTAKLQVPVLVSRSAPTVLALELAAEMSVTLVGFARGRRMNIYTCPQRIVLDHVEEKVD